MTADDLPAAFASLPAAWRRRLPGWTPSAESTVMTNIRAISNGRPIGPPDPFRALRLVPPSAVKVVVFGQDPYPTAGHADGLAFSAGRGKPRSLARIFEVLAQDKPGWTPPADWRLDDWAEQGVLLLNPALTVEIGQSGSHLTSGWLALTSEIVKTLCEVEKPTFLLWGGQAQRFFAEALPAGTNPPVWRTRHPSYDFKREFMADGSHFARTSGQIDWWRISRQ